MPSTVIKVRQQYSDVQEAALIEAVQAALCASFQLPSDDRDVRLLVHAPHRFAYPPTLTRPEAYTVIGIDAFAGRSLDAKRALYRAIVANLEPLGIPPDHTKVVLREIATENWGIRGGQAGCDVALGFRLDV